MANIAKRGAPPAPKLKTGPANFLQEGTKKPFAASPTNFLKAKPAVGKKPPVRKPVMPKPMMPPTMMGGGM